MTLNNVFTKDPDAVLDYSVDWSDWLGPDTILSSSWIVPTGITKESSSTTVTSTTIWLSGGVTHTKYSIVNRVITTGGRTDDRTIIIAIKEK